VFRCSKFANYGPAVTEGFVHTLTTDGAGQTTGIGAKHMSTITPIAESASCTPVVKRREIPILCLMEWSEQGLARGRRGGVFLTSSSSYYHYHSRPEVRW